MSDLGQRIKAIRKHKKITQNQMAKALGVAQSTIANYETNIRIPSLAALKDISSYLGVGVEYLMGIESEVQAPVALDLDCFIECLLKGDEVSATQYVSDAFVEGFTAIQMIETLFIPTLKTIGDMWASGKADIAQEHFVSGVIERLLGLVTTRDIPEKKHAVALMVPGAEEHTLILKMASEYFRSLGWHVTYIGKSIPMQSLLWLIKNQEIDLLVIAVTLSIHLNSAEHLIQALQTNKTITDLKILVGGHSVMDEKVAFDFLKADYFIKKLPDLPQVIKKIELDFTKA